MSDVRCRFCRTGRILFLSNECEHCHRLDRSRFVNPAVIATLVALGLIVEECSRLG